MRLPLRPVLLAASLLAGGPAFGADSPWTRVSEAQIPAAPGIREIVPQKFVVHRADPAALRQALAAAPREGKGGSPLIFSMPTPEGGLEDFKVVESPIMEPGLAEKFPELKTYTAQGVNDPTASGRLDVTPAGFHGYILSVRGTFLIDPYRKGDASHYVTYWKKDYTRSFATPFRCNVHGEDAASAITTPRTPSSVRPGLAPLAQGATLRTYRLAVGATGEYTRYHGGSVAAGLAAQVVAMNRVNAVYEREVTVRMVLVANNNLVVFVNPDTDPYSDGDPNNSPGLLLNENPIVLNSIIGSANYDIGHVFSTAGGGIAGLGVVCSGSKARGVTGTTAPVGDAYTIDYVAHEMGHQFGANHTFNGTTGACGGGNRAGSAAYEPGSGITIMAYAGICGAEDQAPHSIDTFHSKSYDEIVAHITGSADACAQKTSTGNTPPAHLAGPPATVTIPKSTPFGLSEGGWFDTDLSVTYEWEQFDLGNASPPNTDDGTRPIFRAFLPSIGTGRTFPQLSDILANTSTFGESLPTTTRAMHFRQIVRDNKAGGGGVDYVTKTVNVESTAGPFVITSPGAAPGTWTVGSAQTVTWNVASTDVPPVSCSEVNIGLSTDGGQTLATLLTPTTANDGSEGFTVPNFPTARARVEVICLIGNGASFFDFNDGDFVIQVAAGNTAPTLTPGAAIARVRGTAATTASVGTASDGQTGGGGLVVTTTSVPAGITVTGITNVNGAITAQIAAGCAAALGANTVTFQVSDGTLSSTANLTVNVSANPSPTAGNYPTVSVPEFDYGSSAPDAAPADNGSFASMVAAAPGFDGTFFVNPQTGIVAIQNATPQGSFTVTVTFTDNCGAAVQKTFTLNVTAPNQVPVITAGSPVARQKGSPATSAQIATVSDGNDPRSSLVVTVQSAPTGWSVSNIAVNGTSGAVTADVAAACTSSNGTITLKVTDPSNTSSTANLSATTIANTAPVLTYGNASVALSAGTTVNPATGPTDNGSIANITVGASGAYTGTVAVSPTTGVVTIGNAGPMGPHTITVTATDNCGTQTVTAFTLTVGSVGTPSLQTTGVARTRGQSASAPIGTASDPDTAVGTLVVTVQSAPAGISVTGIVNTNGAITANVAASCAAALGANTVVLKVSDGTNEATSNLTVTVSDSATLTPTNAGPICAGQPVQLSVNTVAGATYAWTGPGGFTSSQQNPLVPSAQPGLYSVTATVNGCVSQPYTTTVAAATGCFYAVTPCRVADTRNADGPYGGPALQPAQGRTFTIAGTCGIPADATAVAMNVTVTSPTSAGNLRLYPAGGSLPLVSTINFSPGQTRANNALANVAGNPAGDIVVYADIVGTVHLILDVAGYIK